MSLYQICKPHVQIEGSDLSGGHPRPPTNILAHPKNGATAEFHIRELDTDAADEVIFKTRELGTNDTIRGGFWVKR